jgi:amino acid transporter
MSDVTLPTSEQLAHYTLTKSLRWYDGFVLALANPGFLIGSLGFSIGALGGWGAMLLWGISMIIGAAAARFYAEMASMFPDKPGGLALYAYEAWKKYFSMVGPIATFGYWFAWSTVLSIFGIVVGTLIQTEWFPGSTWTVDLGVRQVGLSTFIAAGVIVLVWLFNVFGIKPAVWIGYVIGVGLMIPLAVFIIGPFVTGTWHSYHMTFGVPGAPVTFTVAMVWLYVMGWSAYGTEAVAVFTPEFKHPREVSRGLQIASLFSLGVYILLPFGITGVVGYKVPQADPVGFYVTAFHKIMGGGGGMMVALICISLMLSMNTATADGSRALYGIARDDMTIKQLYYLNRFKAPARAMLVDMVLNLVLLFFIGNPLAILVAGNLGYILSHFFALSGFLLLRRDRPKWPRPYKVPNYWIPFAVGAAVLNAVFIAYGCANPNLTGYGTTKDLIIGVCVLLISVVLFVIRRSLQDRKALHWREEAPAVPPADEAGAISAEFDGTT